MVMCYGSFYQMAEGYSHILKELGTEDCVYAEQLDSYAFAIASDGLGSKKHFRSAIGSKTACDVARKVAKEYFENKNYDLSELVYNSKKMLQHFARAVVDGLVSECDNAKYTVLGWRKEVIEHFRENPLTSEEKKDVLHYFNKTELDENDGKDKDDIYMIYACTFSMVVMTKTFAFALCTGDSPVVIFDDALAHIPQSTINLNNEMGGTTTLSHPDYMKHFRFYWADEQLPKAMFVCTDGVRDSYTAEGFLAFCTNLLPQFHADKEKANADLKAWLPELTKRGCGDDVSIAGIYTFSADPNHSDEEI